jgi:ATP-dependent Clp protease ATP-binding subunit ClpB
MVRIDMSEFMEQHSVARLIGAPPGYVGYEDGGYLTESVRRRPYSVLLLDEIEKAHSDVFNILLQVMDDGRLTDGQGRTVDFRNTVIVMTSNLGSDRIQELMVDQSTEKVPHEALRKTLGDIILKHFSPEFVNRIDDTVVFHPLGRDEIRDIAKIQIELLSTRLVHNQLSIQLSEKALDKLAEIGYDPIYGARPLKRAIQKKIENPLAEEVLKGSYSAGQTIAIDVNPSGDFLFDCIPLLGSS